MTNPYDAPRVKNAAADAPVDSRKPSKTRKTIGAILLVMALMSLRGLQRPPGSTGSLVDDLPYLGGQLFVSAAVAAVGLFLLLKKRADPSARAR